MRIAAETTMIRALTRLPMAAILAASTLLSSGSQVFALSAFGPAAETPRQAESVKEKPILEAFEASTLPQPSPAIDRSTPQGTAQAPAAQSPGQSPAQSQTQGNAPKPAAPAAGAAKQDDSASTEIIRDMSKLPAAVQQTRQQLVEAAASGDLERLRPLIGTGANQTQVMNGEFEDPIETLKSFAGDQDGQEILAILIDILATGAAHVDVGTPDEAYVWPYFTAKALDTLTPPERVELLRIVTAGDLAGMQENGNYNFFRTGISPDGKWKFISGGD